MGTALSQSAQRVQDVLLQQGVALSVVELPTSTRTAQDAATSIGCEIAQIAKSLIFKGKTSEKPVLVVASGSNRVDEKRIGTYLGEPILRADPEYVRLHTGFAIGGIPPIAHITQPEVFIDEDLFTFSEIWAAAGTPNGVFKLTPSELLTLTQGKQCRVKP